MKHSNAQDTTEHREAGKISTEFVEMLPEVVIKTDTEGTIKYANKVASELFGYSREDFCSRLNIFKLLAPEETDRAKDNLGKVLSGKKLGIVEYKAQKRDGAELSVAINMSCIFDGKGNTVGAVGIIVDITERKRAELAIEYLSFHDKLTGLYNRAYFEEELKRLDTSRQLPLSIVIGDVDSLKLVNDAFGYKEGDELIIGAANVLKYSCRDEDIIARWGGDEFMVVLPKTRHSDVVEIIGRIEKTCKKISPQKIPLSISLGFSVKNKSTQKVCDVIKEAEVRMQKRKLLKSKNISSSIIASLEKLLLEKNRETKDHIEYLTSTALKLGKAAKLSGSELNKLSLLINIHDIGEIVIRDSILTKKRKLTKKEWKIIKKHPEVGYNITKLSSKLAPVAEAILSHHEWWDGTGYPRGLKGNEIPKISRIITIVSAYDAMVNGRVYKEAVSKGEAIEELERYSGKQFDPKLVNTFIKVLDYKYKEMSLFPDA